MMLVLLQAVKDRPEVCQFNRGIFIAMLLHMGNWLICFNMVDLNVYIFRW